MNVLPVLGGLVLLGVLVNLLLGFTVSSEQPFRDVHTGIGYAGLALVVLLAAIAFTRRTATKLSKALMALILVFAAGQVGLGQAVLGGASNLLISHRFTGIILLALVAIQAFVTSRSARRRA